MKANKLSEFKEKILMDIEGTTMWRYQKAEQYPHDSERNVHAAEALNELKEYIKQLPEDHGLFQIGNFTSYFDDFFDILSTQIRMYGFQNQQSSKEFVKELIDIFIKLMEEKDPDSLSAFLGKYKRL